MVEQKQQTTMAPNKFAELLATELSFIAQLENFVAWLTALRNETKLPEKLSTKLFLNELILAYQPVIDLLKSSSIYDMAMKEAKNFIPQEGRLPEVKDDFIKRFNTNFEALSNNLLNNNELEILSDALALLSNNQEYFRQKLASFNSNEINAIYKKLKNKPSSLSVEELSTELESCLSKPTSRVARYTLLLTELYPKNSSELLSIKTITEQSNKKLTPNVLKTQAASQRDLTDTPTKDAAPSVLATKRAEIKLQKRMMLSQAKAKVAEVLDSLAQWEEREKNSWWKVELFSLRKIVKQLRKRLYKNYYLLKTRGLDSIEDVISTTIALIERKRPHSSLITELKEIRDSSIVNLTEENISNNIHTPLLNQIFAVLEEYQSYHSGDTWSKETRLEKNVFNKISADLDNLQKNIATYKPKHGNLWIDIVKIFQIRCHIAGHFPKHFYKGEFGKMLRSLSKVLDAYKPEKYHTAFTLISAPENYHYTEISREEKLPLVLQPKFKTSARLCFNICRIMDFYCNTNLGKVVAENIKDPNKKTNQDQGWKKEILELDATISKLLRTSSESDEETLKLMVAAIKTTISTIQKGWGSTNSRTLGTLKKLAELYDVVKSPQSDEEYNTLPEGVVVSTDGYSDEMILDYINKHITERSSHSLIKYLETDYNRSFLNPTAIAKIDDTIEILDRLNRIYGNSDLSLQAQPCLETSEQEEKAPKIKENRVKTVTTPYKTPTKKTKTYSNLNTPLSPVIEQTSVESIPQSKVENNDNTSTQKTTIDNAVKSFFWQKESSFSIKTSPKKTCGFGDAFKETEDYLTSIGISCKS